MKINKIQFSKIKLQWRIKQYAAGVMYGDEAIGEILGEQEHDYTGVDALRALAGKGYDVLPKEDLQSSNRFFDYIDKALYHNKQEWDAFGNVKHFSRKNIIIEQMDKLKALGLKLLEEEKYELMKEAQEIYERLQKELNKLK